MPKIKTKNPSALKKARIFTLKPSCDSDSEDSIASDSSNELLQYIPDQEPPPIETLSLESENKSNMDIIIAKLDALTATIENVQDRQAQQEEIIRANLQVHQNAQRIQQQHQNLPPQDQQDQNNAMECRVEDFFRIPDPIKSIPSFNGNRKQLAAWISTAENTLNLFKNRVPDAIYQMYTTAVVNKLEDAAKDIICLAGNPQDFGTVKELLTISLGDRQELSTYKCKLWRNRMGDNINIHKYYQKSKEILQNIKTIAKQNELYKNNWEAINRFIEEDGLAAFIAGLHPHYFGHAQAARPKDIEDAYAFLCKFRSQEIAVEAIKTPKGEKPFTSQTIHKTNYTPNKPNFNANKPNNTPNNNNYVSNKNYTKPEYRPRTENIPEPMEVGSTRSKITLNKRIINNNEIESQSDQSEDEDPQPDQFDEGEIAINFCQIGTPKEIT